MPEYTATKKLVHASTLFRLIYPQNWMFQDMDWFRNPENGGQKTYGIIL